MSDFLLQINQSQGARDLVKLMQGTYAHRHPEGKMFQFPWGKLGVLDERFGQNVFELGGTVVAWVGDPVNRISTGFLQALVDCASQARTESKNSATVRTGSVLDQLNGSFSFIVADAQGFSVITDPMNYVQVYSAFDQNGNIVSVGTHSDLVAKIAGQAGALDLTSLGEFLNSGTPLFPNTVYQNVKELYPGSLYGIAISGQAPRLSRRVYWTPPAEVQGNYDERALADELREVLLTIVRARCQVRNVGVFLSGGLDSRLIMAAVPPDVECVGLTFSNNPNRETRTAQKVADCYHREWVPLLRDKDYLADCLKDSVRLIGCEYEWTCGQVIGVAPALAKLNLDVILEGTLFNDYFTAFCAREWQPKKRLGGLLPSHYRKTDWNYLNQISNFCRSNFRRELVGAMEERRKQTYDLLADTQRGSVAEWLEIYPFTQDPSVGYYPAERRTLPVRLAAMDRRALDFSFRCPIELKLGSRLYKKAVCSIYGNGNNIPNANDGVRPGSSHLSRLAQRGIHELKRKGTRQWAQLRGRAEVPHSWHDYQRYWRESAKLRKLCVEYGPNLDKFDGLLFEGRGRDLLAQTDLHWEYGFRLLQLAVWQETIRGYSF
jgi:hypothetical protein